MVSVIEGDAVCIVDDERDELPAKIFPIEECNNVIGVKPDFYETLNVWFNDKLKRLEICILSPRSCQ